MGFGALNEEVGVGWLVTGEVVDGVGEGAVDGEGDVGGDGLLVADGFAVEGVAVVGAGLGLSWVQATGPTRNPATNRAVMTGRRTGLLGGLVGSGEDVVSARIELALDAPDDPVAVVRAHSTFEGVDL